MIFFVALLYLPQLIDAQNFSLSSGKFYDLKAGEKSIKFEFYNGSYDICSNEARGIPLMIADNDEKNAGFYSLDFEGANFASLSSNYFSVPGRQSRIIFLRLTPADKDAGSYSIKIKGISSGNTQKEIFLDLNVAICYSIKLTLEKYDDKLCAGTKKDYGIKVTNEGRNKTVYEVDVKGPDWAFADKAKKRLTVEVPDYAKGVFDITVEAKSENMATDSKKLTISAIPKPECYKAEFLTDGAIINYYSNDFAPVRIKNAGAMPANYTIELDAPKWISSEPKILVIKPGQYANFNLNISPNGEIPAGNYPVRITLKIDGITYTKEIGLILKNKNSILTRLGAFLFLNQYFIYAALLAFTALFFTGRMLLYKFKKKRRKVSVRKVSSAAVQKEAKAIQSKSAYKPISHIRDQTEHTNQTTHAANPFILFIAGMVSFVSLLFLLVYYYDFPISKNFLKANYAYVIAGILISLTIIAVIELYNKFIRK